MDEQNIVPEEVRNKFMHDIVCAYIVVEIKHKDNASDTLSILEYAAANIDAILSTKKGLNHADISDVVDTINMVITMVKSNDVLTSGTDVYDLAWASLQRGSVH